MTTEKHVVLTRPHHRNDPITDYTHAWAGELKRLFEENGWRVTDCEAEGATRDSVEGALRAASADSVFLFYGHGDEDALIGRGGAVCDLRNAALLRGRKVYTVACLSAKRLGPEAVDCGAPVYFGYTEKIHGFDLALPGDGPMARAREALLECANSGMRAWIDRPELTAGEVKRKMRDTYDHWIGYYSHGPGFREPRGFLFSTALRHNMRALKLLGDEEARLT